MVEPPELMPPKSTCLPLDTKYLGERTNSDSSIEHTQRGISKIHIFHQDHKREDKAYNIFSRFLHHFITTSKYLNELNATTEIKHFIGKRVYPFRFTSFILQQKINT